MKDRYETILMEAVNKISDKIYGNIKYLDQYPLYIAKQVLGILIQNACLSQSYRLIELGRNKIGEIMNHNWLIEHFMETTDENIDYADEWEYRRFLELVMLCVPELKDIALAKGMHSENEEVLEAAADFMDM